MVLKDIHGPNLKKMRIVWLSSGNQVGFEIFGFIDPKAERRTNDNLNIGNQDFSISVLPILTWKSCVKKFQKAVANNVVKFGISLRIRGIK